MMTGPTLLNEPCGKQIPQKMLWAIKRENRKKVINGSYSWIGGLVSPVCSAANLLPNLSCELGFFSQSFVWLGCEISRGCVLVPGWMGVPISEQVRSDRTGP